MQTTIRMSGQRRTNFEEEQDYDLCMAFASWTRPTLMFDSRINYAEVLVILATIPLGDSFWLLLCRSNFAKSPSCIAKGGAKTLADETWSKCVSRYV